MNERDLHANEARSWLKQLSPIGISQSRTQRFYTPVTSQRFHPPSFCHARALSFRLHHPGTRSSVKNDRPLTSFRVCQLYSGRRYISRYTHDMVMKVRCLSDWSCVTRSFVVSTKISLSGTPLGSNSDRGTVCLNIYRVVRTVRSQRCICVCTYIYIYIYVCIFALP